MAGLPVVMAILATGTAIRAMVTVIPVLAMATRPTAMAIRATAILTPVLTRVTLSPRLQRKAASKPKPSPWSGPVRT